MKVTQYVLLGTLMLPGPVQAQGFLGNILRDAARRGEASNRQQATQQTERQEQLSKVDAYIQRLPDEACKLPKSHIEKWILDNLDHGDLMETLRKTVFFETDAPPSQSGYDKMLESFRQDTARREATSRAFYSGGQTSVGQPAGPAKARYQVDVFGMKATDRIEGGLNCSADVRAGALRFPVTYTVVLDPGDAEGWNGSLNTPEFTETFALAHPDRIKINFQVDYTQNKDLSLAEARVAAVASRNAQLETRRQQDAATPRHSRAAYQGCQALEGGVKKIIEGNSDGTVKVIEVATFEDSAGARSDGTLSCSGAVYTNRGTVRGNYGTSRSPKGQLLIEWRPEWR